MTARERIEDAHRPDSPFLDLYCARRVGISVQVGYR